MMPLRDALRSQTYSHVMDDKSSVMGKILKNISIDILERQDSVVSVLDPQFRFLYCNPAWDRFYFENGGTGNYSAGKVLGTSIFDVIPLVLEKFYKSLFEKALSSLRPVEFEFECSSPSEYRLFRMNLMPMEGGLIMANDLIKTRRLEEGVLLESPFFISP